MSKTVVNTPRRGKPSPPAKPGISPTGWLVTALGICLVVGVIYVAARKPEKPVLVPAKTGAELVRPSPEMARYERSQTRLREVSVFDPIERARPTARRPTATTPALPKGGGSSVAAQQLVSKLTKYDLRAGNLTPQQAADLNRMFQELIAQGGAGVAAIQDFLAQNEDISFDSIPGGQGVDYATLRLGLLDALLQAGGDEAMTAIIHTLRGTSDPREIALLARSLEQAAPDEYRDQALAAARNALAMSLRGQWDGRDVSPLFEVLQHLGDERIVADLTQAVKAYNYYATLSLAGMADGAGIPALVRLASNPEVAALGNGDYALRPLAQVALQYPEAEKALLDAARANRIRDTAWPTVASALAGVYIQYGTQIFGSSITSAQWTAAEIGGRIAMIDGMLAVTSNPTGVQALRSARSTLEARLPK